MLVLECGGQPITFRAFKEKPLVLTIESMTDFNQPYQWLLAGQPWDVIETSAENGNPFAIAVYNYFESGEMAKDGVLVNQLRKFKTVAVDTITHVQQVTIREQSGNLSALPAYNPKGVEIQHWGKVLNIMNQLTNLYFKLPLNVVMSALTARDRIEAMGQILFCPALQGQSSLIVPSNAEAVLRLINIETLNAQQAQAIKASQPEEYAGAFNVALTRGGRNFLAKWQGLVSLPPSVVVAPSATKLLDILLG